MIFFNRLSIPFNLQSLSSHLAFEIMSHHLSSNYTKDRMLRSIDTGIFPHRFEKWSEGRGLAKFFKDQHESMNDVVVLNKSFLSHVSTGNGFSFSTSLGSEFHLGDVYNLNQWYIIFPKLGTGGREVSAIQSVNRSASLPSSLLPGFNYRVIHKDGDELLIKRLPYKL